MPNKPHESKKAVTWRLDRTLLGRVAIAAAENKEPVVGFAHRALTAEVEKHESERRDR